MIKAPVVKFDGVTKYYRVGGRCVAALEDVSFEIGEGVTGLVGPNGVGKTTAIRLMLGLIKPSRGHIYRNFSFSDVAYIPQGAHPDDFLTLYENMVVALRLHGLSKSASELVAKELIDEFGLAEHAGKPAFRLSEGLRRKSLVIPVLFGLEKKLYILDEPFEYLDYETRLAVVDRLRELKARGAVVVVSTHNIYEARQVLDRAIVLRNRLIRILELHEVQELENVLKAAQRHALY